MMRSDFLYWVMATYLRPAIVKMIGVPSEYNLTPKTEAEINDILATTFPSSSRMDGFYFDNYQVNSEFYEEVSPDSPYSVYKIQAPVLVINAMDDPLAVPKNVRSMVNKIPNARLVVLPDGGHPILGHSQEVNAAMIQFLQSNVAMPVLP